MATNADPIMIVVADSSALVALSTCSVLHLLDQIYADVRVPHAVFQEVTIEGKPQSAELAAFLQGKVVEVKPNQIVRTSIRLGLGELEAMLLYKQIGASHLLIDDQRAKKVAIANNIQTIGTLGILLLAKQKGLISSIKPLIHILRNSSLHYNQALLARVIQLADESA